MHVEQNLLLSVTGSLTSSCYLTTAPQSAEYDKRVANISLFVYIGWPGLHQNSRQAPGSSRQAACTYASKEVSQEMLLCSAFRVRLLRDPSRLDPGQAEYANGLIKECYLITYNLRNRREE